MELVDPECFLGLSLIEKYRMILLSLGSDECVFTEQQFYRAWLRLLDPSGCLPSDLDELQLAVYTNIYG